MKLIMEESVEIISLKSFKRKFLEEYFPESVRYSKEVEFL